PPEAIILLGLYAYWSQHVQIDVDLLVIMPTRDVVNQSIRICMAFDEPFSLDLIVRTAKQIERGLKDDDWFLREIIEKGKVVYEAANGSLDTKSRGGLGGGGRFGGKKAAPSRPGVFPLPASGGKVPQGPA